MHWTPSILIPAKHLCHYWYQEWAWNCCNKLFLPCHLLVPIVAPRSFRNRNRMCLMHEELNSLCIRHLRFLFRTSLDATIGTKSWHEGIAAIMKMAVCELRDKVHETDQQQTTDRPLLLFGHLCSWTTPMEYSCLTAVLMIAFQRRPTPSYKVYRCFKIQ